MACLCAASLCRVSVAQKAPPSSAGGMTWKLRGYRPHKGSRPNRGSCGMGLQIKMNATKPGHVYNPFSFRTYAPNG